MSKGLKTLKEIFDAIEAVDENANCHFDMEELADMFGDVEKELKEYEGAKNHIEALHKERVENSLKLKAFEIIKERCVNTYDEIFCCDTFEEYQDMYHYAEEKFNLTEDEWLLLKEVLCNEIY